MSATHFPARVQSNIVSQAEVQTPMGGTMHCEIRAGMQAGLLDLQGVVWSDEEMIGSYSFNLVKHGSSGSSSTAQRGVFSLVPNEEKVVGMITVNVPEGHTYYAQLHIQGDDADVTCDFNFG